MEPIDDAPSLQHQPPVKRRRSIFDLSREQQQRQGKPPSATQNAVVPIADEACATAEVSTALLPSSTALLPSSTAEPQSLSAYRQDSLIISEEVGHWAEEEENNSRFEIAALNRSKQLEASWQSSLLRRDSKTISTPTLTSSEDLSSDLSVKNGLRIGTPYSSFKWLRRLPSALRTALPRSAEGSLNGLSREAVLGICREHLKGLMGNPDMAVKWVERISACLMWFEVEGPSLALAQLTQAPSAVPEERSRIRRVDEWDEAYRSLEELLRQGVISCFVIAGERFTVTVLDQAPWASDTAQSVQTGDAPRSSKPGGPCAIMCPSQHEIRSMLQENHVAFQIADVNNLVSNAAPPEVDAAVVTNAIVPVAPAGKSVPASNQRELLSLRRAGESVVTPEQAKSGTPQSSALLFEGVWCVHGMLDVLRQFLLGQPLTDAPASRPKQLPRLLSPAPFNHAAAHTAEVVKTQTLGGSAAADAAAAACGSSSSFGTQAPDQYHTVELSGCFFPNQVRRLLELLRVPLPNFTCRLASDTRHSTGINAFSRLGMFHVEGVRCDSRVPSAAIQGEREWNWDFELAGG